MTTPSANEANPLAKKGLFAIDAHCHLSDSRVSAHASEWIKASGEKGIGGFCLGGLHPEEWQNQKALKARYGTQVATSFGLHPWWVDARARAGKGIEEGFKALTRELPDAEACGELGLDYARDRQTVSGALQLEVFKRQLELAVTLNKPLILHVVGGRAHEEVLGILKGYTGRIRGMVHSFSGSAEQAQVYVGLGLMISIQAGVMREGPRGETLRKTVGEVSPEWLVLETDSPDQGPVAGEFHTPVTLLEIAQAVARLRGEVPEATLLKNTANLERLYSRKFF